MKDLQKRLLSGILSCVILFASTVMASAQMVTDLSSPVKGSGAGKAINEGASPSQIVDLLLPTGYEHMFDFYLDPQGNIKDTGAISVKAGGTTVGDGYMLFVNHDSTGAISGLSKDSDNVTIINKGHTALNVSLNVTVDKGGNDFSFSNNPSFLDESGKVITGPAMYLALISGEQKSAVATTQEPENGPVNKAVLDTWIASNAPLYQVDWNASDKKYEYVTKEGVTLDDFKRSTFYMTGAINGDPWKGVAETNNILLEVTWNATYEQGPDSNPYENLSYGPEVIVLTPAQKFAATVKMVVDYGLGDKAMTKLEKLVYKKTDGESAELLAGSNQLIVDETDKTNVTLIAVAPVYRGSDWYLVFSNDEGQTTQVPVNLKRDIIVPDVDPTVTVVTQATAAGEQAMLAVTYGSGHTQREKVNRVVYTNPAGVTAYLSGAQLTVDDTSVAVTAVAPAYNGSDWQVEFTDEDGTNPILVPFELKPESDIDPTVTVDTQATAIGNQVSLTVSYGSGTTKRAKVNRLVYKNPVGNTAYVLSGSVLIIDGTSVTLTAVAPVFNGSDWQIEFTDEDGNNPILVPFSLKPEVDADPTVTVDTQATAIGNQVSLTVSYGSGTTKRAKVNRLAYKNPVGNTAYIVSGAAQLTVAGTSVTITAVAPVFNGSDWQIEFTDEDGNNPILVPFSLKSGSSGGSDTGVAPTVSVTAAATAIGSTATLSVTMGSGMKVNRLKYTNPAGTVAYFDAGSSQVTVSGNTVSILAIAPVYNGSGWQIEFTDSSGGNAKLVSFNLK